jgi:hypothetical protein
MDDINKIENNLEKQLKILETDVVKTSYKLKTMEKYIGIRMKRLNRLVPSLSQSKNWANRLSHIIDLFDEIQVVLAKMDEVDDGLIEISFEEADFEKC